MCDKQLQYKENLNLLAMIICLLHRDIGLRHLYAESAAAWNDSSEKHMLQSIVKLQIKESFLATILRNVLLSIYPLQPDPNLRFIQAKALKIGCSIFILQNMDNV